MLSHGLKLRLECAWHCKVGTSSSRRRLGISNSAQDQCQRASTSDRLDVHLLAWHGCSLARSSSFHRGHGAGVIRNLFQRLVRAACGERGVSTPSVAEASADCFWEEITAGEDDSEQLLTENIRGAEGIQKSRWVVADRPKEGEDPFAVLQEREEWDCAEVRGLLQCLADQNRLDEALEVLEWYRNQVSYRPNQKDYCHFIHIAAVAKRPEKAEELFQEMVGKGVLPTVWSFTSLVHAFAESGLFLEAEKVLSEMVATGVKPSTVTYSCLIHAYGKNNLYDEMAKVFNTMKSVGCVPDADTYSSLVQSYARGGLIQRMSKAYKDMAACGWGNHSACVNQMIQAYAMAGSIKEMESGYALLRNQRLGVSKDSIKAMAHAYIHKCYFFQLSMFVRNAGLKRKNLKNLLWNLLLLSYAANFSMKNLEREFTNMKLAGFKPDLSTFNIRARAFANMHMYWDLHITVQHMLSDGIQPDLITLDALVGAYLDGRLEAKLAAAVEETRCLHLHPKVRTESYVFQAFGKGNLHMFYEELLACLPQEQARKLTNADVVSLYLQYVKRKQKEMKFQSGHLRHTSVG